MGYSTVNYGSLKQDIVRIEENKRNNFPNKLRTEGNEILSNDGMSENEFKKN